MTAATLETRKNRTALLAFGGALAMLDAKGLVRGSRPHQQCADVLSFLISPESYTQLVIDAGWSRSAYLAWLEDAIERLVLAS